MVKIKLCVIFKLCCIIIFIGCNKLKEDVDKYSDDLKCKELVFNGKEEERRIALDCLNLLGKNMVDINLKILDDNDYLIKRNAIEYLGEVGEDKISVILISKYGKIGEDGRILAALNKIKSIKIKIKVIEIYKREKSSEKKNVIGLLASIGGEEALELILKDIDEITELSFLNEAVLALAKFKDILATKALIKKLKSEHVRVRAYAAKALGNTETREVEDELISCIRNEKEVEVRVSAAEALGMIEMKDRIGILEELQKKEDSQIVKAAIAFAIIKSDINEYSKYIEAIYNLTKSYKEEDRKKAVELLGKTNNIECADILITMLEDVKVSVRMETVKALARLKCAKAVNKIIYCHKDYSYMPNIKYQEEMINYLGEIGGSKAIKYLIELLGDTRNIPIWQYYLNVRYNRVHCVARALEKIAKKRYEVYQDWVTWFENENQK